MLLLEDILSALNQSTIPAITKTNLTELATLYQKLSNLEKDKLELYLLAVERYYDENFISEEIKCFDDFFKIALILERDKNGINRFFDAALGIRTLGNLTKMEEILKEKTLGETKSQRVRGSFEYAHTQTHYSLLMDVFNYLLPKDGESIIDVGSGFGRVGLFIGLCFPKVQYLGLELVAERVECSNKAAVRNNFKNISFKEQDLLLPEYALPTADYYYFYDPLELEGLQKVSLDLKNQSVLNQRKLKIIALSGYDEGLITHFNNQDWLQGIRSLKDEYFKQTGQIYQS